MISNDFRDDIQFSEENYDDVICNLEKIYNPEIMLELILTNQAKIMNEDKDDLS